MELHQLHSKQVNANNSPIKRKRIGRGIGSGIGKTSGKGQKGQNSRTGGGVRLGFEGGQTPIYRRVGKFGFNNYHHRVNYSIINVGSLEKFKDGDKIGLTELIAANLVEGSARRVKVLSGGTLSKKITISAAKFSKAAEEKIAKVGGVCEVINK